MLNLRLINRGSRTLVLQPPADDPEAGLFFALPEPRVAPGDDVPLQVRVAAPEALGDFERTFVVRAQNEAVETSVEVKGRTTEPAAVQTPLVCSPQMIRMQGVAPGEVRADEVTVRTRDGAPFALSRIEVSPAVFAAEPATVGLEQEHRVCISYTGRSLGGLDQGALLVFAEGEQTPARIALLGQSIGEVLISPRPGALSFSPRARDIVSRVVRIMAAPDRDVRVLSATSTTEALMLNIRERVPKKVYEIDVEFNPRLWSAAPQEAPVIILQTDRDDDLALIELPVRIRAGPNTDHP
jgi:hypothetical protein